jgi:hypothetical protein
MVHASVFRRRSDQSGRPLAALDDADREAVVRWWQRAVERIQAGPQETSWLTATIMVEMSLGYAMNSGKRVPPLAYAFATRTGYALRMFVDQVAASQPLDVSTIEADSVAKLATLPRDEETGTIAATSDESEQLMTPIVVLATDTAEQADRFTAVVSVEPALWSACVEIAIHELRSDLQQRGVIRRKRDLGPEAIESFLRYGFVLRCIDEAFAINTAAE